MLLKDKSSKDKGTLYHLKVLLNHKRVKLNNSKIPDFNAADDFFKISVSAHIISAAMQILNMSDIDDDLGPNDILSNDEWVKDEDDRQDGLYALCSKIVDKYVDFETDFTLSHTEKSDDDKVLEYASLVLSWGLLHMEFCDAIKEGDGLRVHRCWKYMFLFFKCTNRVNYSIEAFTLLAQHMFLLSERQAHQLLWCRFVNVHGLPARNIPCDLYMEHLNRISKEAVNHLKANKTLESLVRVSKVVGILEHISANFGEENEVTKRSGKHKVASQVTDIRRAVNVLTQECVFHYKPLRMHESFKSITRNPMSTLDHEKLSSWMYAQLQSLIHGF